MKNIPSNIFSIIQGDIDKFREYYKETLTSSVKLINTVIQYISKRKGKQIRPILTLLGSRLCGEPNKNTYRSAAMVEILHVATLIHDDVVDDAHLRRGIPSINRIWKNKISILVGDYMFSKALSNMISIKNFDALNSLSVTAERLSRGEILQIERAIKKEMSEEVYFRMVSDKTASLFSTACELGAITTSEDSAKRSAMKNFGEKLGIAFQIKDDLFDILGNIENLGKPTGFDVKKNLLTLPLIHLFSNMNIKEKNNYKRKLKKYSRKNDYKSIRNMIQSNGGIQYSEDCIRRISNEAKRELEIFPDSNYKQALISVLDFNMVRET